MNGRTPTVSVLGKKSVFNSAPDRGWASYREIKEIYWGDGFVVCVAIEVRCVTRIERFD